MPAAAVIPAPIAYIKVVAVKKLVVGFLGTRGFGTLPMKCGPIVPQRKLTSGSASRADVLP